MVKKKTKGNWDKNQFKKSKTKGNPDAWSNAAKKLLKKDHDQNGFLEKLGLSELPESLKDLKRIYRKAMLKAHPDKGGSELEASEVNRAYEFLKEKY